MSKFCPNCQSYLDETMIFCLMCGKLLVDEDKSKEEIINCSFQYQCPLDWNNLQTTENEDIRFCSSCNRNVYFAHSQLHINSLARERKCIAVHPRNKIFYDDKLQYEPPLMGVVVPTENFEQKENIFVSTQDETQKSTEKFWWQFWK